MKSVLAFVVGIATLFLLEMEVDGHGNMVWPYSWIDYSARGLDSKSGWGHGCRSDSPITGVNDCLAAWFTNDTRPPNVASVDDRTLPPKMYDPTPNVCKWKSAFHKYCQNPWYQPGRAPIYSPCGAAGGNPLGCSMQSDEKPGEKCPGGGYALGKNAEDYSYPEAEGYGRWTNWKRNSNEKVAWTVVANHRGGYSYRLCRVPEGGMGKLTEECFTKMPLDFVGETQWVRPLGHDEFKEVEAVRTKEGTWPKGSHWTKTYAFPELGDKYIKPWLGNEGTILDQVKVPNLEPGKYVLSFRVDFEMTPQIWNICSNINIV